MTSSKKKIIENFVGFVFLCWTLFSSSPTKTRSEFYCYHLPSLTALLYLPSEPQEAFCVVKILFNCPFILAELGNTISLHQIRWRITVEPLSFFECRFVYCDFRCIGFRNCAVILLHLLLLRNAYLQSCYSRSGTPSRSVF